MMTKIVWAVAIVLSAVAGGVALSHVLEIPGKRDLPAPDVATIQQRLYPGFRWFGMFVEPIGLLSSVALAILLWGDGATSWLASAAAVSYLLMGAVFPLVTEPANRLIAAWDPDGPPDRWAETVRRWEMSHGLRATLMLLSATLLVIAALFHR